MTHKHKIHALLVSMALAGSSSATTALIDFGLGTAAADSPYNSAAIIATGADGTTGEVPLSDTDSMETNWTVTVTDAGTGNSGNAGGGANVTAFPAELAAFDPAALGNSIFANQGGGTDPAMILLFSGLAPSGSYDLILYGSRANAQGVDQRWSLTQGSGGDDVDHNSELNSTVFVDWVGITPNENGEIEVTINSPGPDMVGALALNFASITETSVIELVTSFATDVDTASPGNPATLSWVVVEPLTTLTLDDGSGGAPTDLSALTTAGEGSIMVTPSETTTYALTATQGDDSQTVSIEIISGEAPDIQSFEASSSFVEAGSEVELTWDVAGATALSLDPDAVDVSGTTELSLTPTGSTTYTLTATNAFGSSTAEVLVDVLTSPLPTNRHHASGMGNTDTLWMDQVGNQNWNMTGATLNSPLTAPSANTNITAAYSTTGGTSGGSTGSFQYPEFSTEIWFRPGDLTADHQVIFETGGGQNGISALITDSAIRFLGSSADARNLDITIPTVGLNMDDFIQLVMTNSSETGIFTASVRDTFGTVRTATEEAAVFIGTNGAGLFVWASGALGTSDNNLGGRSEAAGVTPEGLTGFTGEIGIVNVYDFVLEPADIAAAFSRVASIGSGPSGLAVTEVSFDDASDQMTITWNSINGQSYNVEFSTSLRSDEWFDFAGPFEAASDQTTQVLNLPPNQDRFFVRVAVDAP